MGTASRQATPPLAAVAGGFLAGVAGTACMDTARYLMSLRAGAKESAAVWASDYAVLPEAGLYKPIWKYDALTLAGDLGSHLTNGAATGTAFWLLTRKAAALTRRG
ncbi:MAG TPA: hypothetical protein VGH53_19610 [Streptosporangiaceae bacterium]